jgi:hypothetical protein
VAPYGTALKPAAVANILYATSSDGGIHRSTDAGCTWNEMARLRELDRQWEVGIETTHASPVYIHTPYDVIQLRGDAVEAIPVPGEIVMLAVSPSEPLRLRSIGRNGVARESSDGGRNWTILGNFGSGNVDVAVVDPASFDHLVAAAGGVMYSSTDGGRSWTSGFAPGGEVSDIAFSPVDPRIVWMQARNGPLAPGVMNNTHVSEDGGLSFRILKPSVSCDGRSFAPHPMVATLTAVACSGFLFMDSSGSDFKYSCTPRSVRSTTSLSSRCLDDPPKTVCVARMTPGATWTSRIYGDASVRDWSRRGCRVAVCGVWKSRFRSCSERGGYWDA